MPETKIDFENLGQVSLMSLDTSSFFLPYGPPLSDLLHRAAWQEESLRDYIRLTALDFPAGPLWSASLGGQLTVVPLEGQPVEEAVAVPESAETAERGVIEAVPEALVEPAPAEPIPPVEEAAKEQSPVEEVKPEPEPSVAGLLALEVAVRAVAPQLAEPSPALSPASPESASVALPRFEPFPLRRRMTIGPPPRDNSTKTAPSEPKAALSELKLEAKAAPAPAVKAAPKPPATPTRADSAAPDSKAPIPAGLARSPAVKPVVIPAAKAAKPADPPSAVKPATPAEAVAPQSVASPTPPPPLKPELKPDLNTQPKADAVSKLDQEPETESDNRLETKLESISIPTFGGRVSSTDSSLDVDVPAEGGFLSSVPVAVKVGVPLLAIIGALGFFVMGDAGPRATPVKTSGTESVSVGGQGWVTEWASDAAGSRRGRQLTMYRPSAGLADYDFEFTGRILNNAMGWVFRAQDTKNYYGMKLAASQSGLTLERLAVVEGRESSVSSKATGLPVKPAAVYRVRLEARGPRFSVTVEGQPVEVWMDNRLRTGPVGFMNEREERAEQLAVEFRFPKVK